MSMNAIQVLHEIEDDDYRMTVASTEDGRLLFSWAMPIEDAKELAARMQETLEPTYEPNYPTG
jgi:hypothetical protein